MSALLQADADLYRPRPATALGRWRACGAAIKAYGVRAGSEPIDTGLADEARRLLEAEGPPEATVGFSILHRGEEAVWLLLHWWMPGGILAERLWRRPLDGAAGFEPIARPLMACVWELTLIGFERDAYVATVMAGRSREDYLARVRPDGDT